MTYDGRPSSGKALAATGSDDVDRYFYVYRAWVDADKMASYDWPTLREGERVLDAELVQDKGLTVWRLTILVDPA